MNYLDKFNVTYLEFLTDLIEVCPEDSEFPFYKTTSEAAIFLDSKIVHYIFHENVVKLYSEKILNREEEFFINHNYEDVHSVIDSANTNEIISKIKSYWLQLNKDNQEIVWKYFRILILLSKKIMNERENKQ